MTDQKQGRPTIRDVASEAKVSISTVSLYVQGRSGVGQETGERIAAAIDKLGYVPRTRTKNGGVAKIFGLLVGDLPVPAFSDRFYGEVIRAIEAEARELGYSMLFSVIEPGRIPPMIVDDQVKGVMIVGGSQDNDRLAVQLAERNVPLVLVDNYVPGLRVNALVPDNVRGGFDAMAHLVELGHRRIAIIEGPHKYKTLTDRLYGALRAADELGLDLTQVPRQPSLSAGRSQKGYLEMRSLLKLPERPTAVFTISDRAALGALEAVKEAGLRVPDDLSLIGFDDVADSTPPLTTVGVSKREIGMHSMRRLVEVIDGKDDLPVRSCIYTELLVRASTSACRSRA